MNFMPTILVDDISEKNIPTLVDKTAALLRKKIIDGTIKAEAKIRIEPTRKMLGVGSSTIRESLSLLVAHGLVIQEGRKGFTVAPMSTKDFMDLTKVRVMLECEAARLSVALSDDLWEAKLSASIHMLNRVEEKLSSNSESIIAWDLANRDFHFLLLSNCDSLWLLRILSILYTQSERYRYKLNKHRSIDRDVHEEHRQIFECALKKDSKKLTDLLSKHIWRSFYAYEKL